MRTSKGKIVERYYAEYAQQLYESTQSNKEKKPRFSETIKSKVKEKHQQGDSDKVIVVDIQEEFGTLAPAESTIRRWLKAFRDGQMSTIDRSYSRLGDEPISMMTLIKRPSIMKKGFN